MKQTNIFLKAMVLFKLQLNASLTLKELMLIALKSAGEEGGKAREESVTFFLLSFSFFL